MARASPVPMLAVLAAGADAQVSSMSERIEQAVPPGNVLLIVADDLGCDMVGLFGQHPDAPPTPTLDLLAAAGNAFTSTYSDPLCSPTRACILTGRYGFRTGFGEALQVNAVDYSLPLAEITLPEALASSSAWPVAHSAIGKWHLAALPGSPEFHPNQQGFGWFEGTLGNLYLGQNYFSHSKVLNGVFAPSSTYATTEQVDDAIARTESMPQPWFLHLAFNAPHAPFHAPPAGLHGYPLSGDPELTPQMHFRAMAQALDTEMGRLFASIDPSVLARTTVIFVGDNGSPNEVVTPPAISGENKGTLSEGGVHVPLIIAGYAVAQPGARCDALVNSVDLYPTVLELLGVAPADFTPAGTPMDGISLIPYLADPTHAPLRAWVYASRFSPNGFGPYGAHAQMLRTKRWKLIERSGEAAAFFDFQSPQGEGLNLLDGIMTNEQKAAFDALAQRLQEVVSS